MELCENCGKPATMLKVTSRGDVPTCDVCKPGDWTGEARPVVEPVLDLSGRSTLSKVEAARVLGVSVDHLERHVLPHLRVIRSGAKVLIPVTEIEAWISQSSARALKDT
jgi:excisionase family DNA binding protein